METRKIKIMASYDWSMRYGMVEFTKFLDPVIRYKGKEYKLELGRVIAEPIVCGQDLKEVADFVVDRTVHWNAYYRCWAQQALHCQMAIANNPNSFYTHEKHSTYDLMARAMHPADRFPTTVLLPQFYPYTEDQERQELWEYEQELIVKYTKFGYDEFRRQTDWQEVQSKLQRSRRMKEQSKFVRELFYSKEQYIKDTVEKIFQNRFPLYLKKTAGGGGSDVYKVESLEELYRKYDETGGRSFHLQEAIENYDVFVRCMGLGPQILPMKFLPEKPLHEHYSPEKLILDPEIHERLVNYVQFINSYFRWTYNSFECLVKGGQIHPIDFANACPDSNFTSLHVHFPWLLCAKLRWFAYCVVVGKDMKMDMEENEYLKIFNDPTKSQLEKYQYHVERSKEYFEVEKFQEFCQENFSDLTDQMIRFYDTRFDDVIRYAIHFSDFPVEEHATFYAKYKEMMAKTFRPNAKEYLITRPGLPW